MTYYLHDILAVDTETTGLDTASADIIEIGLAMEQGDGWAGEHALYRPSQPIPPEAAAVHDITDAMVAGRPMLSAETAPQKLLAHKGYLAAHNAAFDRVLLDRCLGYRPLDGVGDPDRWICTLRLARHVLPDSPKHTLQYLRHALGLNLDRTIAPHRAGMDAVIVGHLLNALIERAIAANLIDPQGDIAVEVANLARRPIPIEKWPFGKHQGVPMAEIDQDYLEWAVLNLKSLQEGHDRYDPDLAEAVAAEMIRRLGDE